ncbi:MAG: DUF2062 domain-containing protein, partial [Bacteroidota bacterium]
MKSDLHDFKSVGFDKVCVLIPSFNNEKTLAGVVQGVLSQTKHVIVVNDGSTDSTASILAGFRNIQVVSHTRNLGKGRALRTGFKHALALGYDYAITIDSDGQHDPRDIPKFMEYVATNGPCLIIGARNMEQESVPTKSSFGNKFSNFWFFVETGIRLEDTQSGFRLYPIRKLEHARFFTSKFEFEIEVIVRAAWQHIPVKSIPVSVIYFKGAERVSHFRPFTDFTRISILNTFLVIWALLFFHPFNALRKFFSKSTWIGIKSEIINADTQKGRTSLSIATGIFFGIVPIWGFQMLTALGVSHLLKLNKPLVILSANISLPPMIPIVVFASYQLGALWLGDQAAHLEFSRSIGLEDAYLNIKQYLIGSVMLA